MIVAAACSLPAAAGWAIDNPDAPDLLGQFQARALAYEKRVGAAVTTHETVAASAAYERFLDAELKQAYAALAAKLDAEAQATLARSQQRWLAWRDAEFRFIESNWTSDRFGTSAALSRGAYRSSIVKGRAAALLQYLKNYP